MTKTALSSNPLSSSAQTEQNHCAFLRRCFLGVHPLQSVAETWVLCLLLLWAVAAMMPGLARYATTNGLLFLLGVCGMWCVLRTRLPTGGWVRQTTSEAVVASLLGAVMVAGLLAPAQLSPWWQARVDTLAALNGGSLMLVALFVATGVGYFFTRGALRLLLLWNRLRQQRLIWSITHAHLSLVVLVVLAAALAMALAAPYARVSPTASEQTVDWVTTYAARFIVTVLPTVGVFVVMGVLALLVVLPPSALISYFIARRTTRRLENLAQAAAALRAGDYSARSAVEGQDEVAQLQSDFNAMADELERSLHALQAERDRVAGLLDARRALVANVSHELRTPVATVRAALESSVDRWDETPSEQLRANLAVMQGEVLRLQGLIDDLFTLSRADAGRLPVQCAPVDVAEVARRMVEALAPLAWRSGRVQVLADLPAGLPRASADEGRLEQVLANLLRNAIRHTPPGGIVVLRAAAITGSVQIQVCDTGEGIAAEDLPHLWGRFYRGETGRQRDAAGAGLGLALVKELTEAMGGSVAVESTLGAGSCFSVTFVC
jgi:signal transduction histidine kinase